MGKVSHLLPFYHMVSCQPNISTEPTFYPHYLNIKQLQPHNLFALQGVRTQSCSTPVSTMQTSPRNKTTQRLSDGIIQNNFSSWLEWTCTAPSWLQEATRACPEQKQHSGSLGNGVQYSTFGMIDGADSWSCVFPAHMATAGTCSSKFDQVKFSRTYTAPFRQRQSFTLLNLSLVHHRCIYLFN